jgi:enamine deaminase RidA (YjgF/YER057c/UK114 family)
MPRRAINSPDYDVPIAGFSQVIVGEVGHTPLYVSGLTARTADGTIVGEGDLEAQTRQVCENMRNVLAAAGATLDDVVQIRTFVRDITQWEVLESVWRGYWGEVWPASTLVQISRLYDERQLIEMEAVALVESEPPGS